MPNNKGAVPMYNENPQYSATINPQIPQGSPAMFGTQFAKEAAGLGDTISKWGTKLVDYAVQMQERDDNAFILEKDNQMRSAMTDLLYNPQNGLANQKGKNSFGATLTYDDELDKLTQNAMSEIKNPILQAKLQEKNMQWVNSLRTNIAKHEGGERFTYYSNNMAGSALSAKNIGLQIGGIGGMHAAVGIIDGLRDTGKTLLGWDDTMADNWIRERKSEVFDALVKDCIDRGDTAGQQALVDIFGGDVNGQSLLGAKSKLAVIQEQQDAVKMLDDAIKAHPEWIVDGVLDEAKVSEWIENNYGQNAPDRVERVLVKGGGGSSDRFVRIAQKTAAIIRQKFPDASPNLEAYLYGQMMHETGWGKDSIALEYNNFAGLHGGAEGRKYADDDEYSKDYASFFTNGYHTNAIYATDGTDFARRLSNKLDGGSGWYTDRNYQAYGNTVQQAMAEYEKKAKAGGKNGYTLSNHTFYTVKPGKEQEVLDLTHDTWVKLQALSAAFERQFGGEEDFEPFFVTAAGSTSGHNPGSKHYSMEAFDIAMDSLKRNPERFKWLEENAPKYGLKPLNEYDGYGNEQWADGENFHFSNNGTPIDEKKIAAEISQGSGAHYEERRVSGFNPVMRDAMMARAKQMAANYKSDNTRKFNSYRDMLQQLPEIQQARDISEFRTVFQRYAIPQYMWDGLANAIGFNMKANISHENRVEADKVKDRKEAAETVNAYILNEERNGRTVTSNDLFTNPELSQAFSRMSPGNQRSMYEEMRKAETSNDAHIGWYKGAEKDAFEDAVSSMKKSNGLDDMWVPNLRAGISAANMERKKKGEPAMSPADIQQYVAGQAMNWKVKGKLWGENSSDQMRAALLPGQYVSEDGRTVYDADGTELVWDEDMKMYRRP